jgi:chromosome segregation protein
VFLKSLTLKGFKSFAEPTTLEFEPGVTVVVGPNGSGKSNVVDAVAWVLGAQGPSTLRSAKMEDVIFAGTAQRAALGRAEVSLTIDNSAGLLPIDFSEVTISRTLFRTGESEYAINRVPCRLLDIQELLSDTGVGRQQHVIVSQGNLDAILNSRPEDRRLVIEEAAGVLKFRRRKERAERRLESTEASLVRLQDLQREVRRQLRPLEKQADAARRHGDLVAELASVRRYLLGRELGAIEARLAAAGRDRNDLGRVEAELRAALAALDADLLAAEAEADSEAEGAASPDLDLVESVSRAEATKARAAGLVAVLAERRRSLLQAITSTVDQDVIAALESESAALHERLARADEEAGLLPPRFEELAAAEAALARESAAVDDERVSDGLTGGDPVVATRGELAALRSSIEQSDDEARRLDANMISVERRTARLTTERQRLQEIVDDAAALTPALTENEHRARDAEENAERRLDRAASARSQADSDHQRWVARAETLAQALDDARGRAGAERLEAMTGFIGAMLELVEVDEGFDAAFEAAAGEALAAVAIDGVEAARAGLAELKAASVAGAVVALPDPGWVGPTGDAGGPDAAEDVPAAAVPAAGAGWLRGRVRSRLPGVENWLDRLLASAVVVDGGWAAAVDVSISHPALVVVTREGDRYAQGLWQLGAGSRTVTAAAVEHARQQAAEAAAGCARADIAWQEARGAAASARAERDRAARGVEGNSARQQAAVDARQRVQAELAETTSEHAVGRSHREELTARWERDRARIIEMEALLPGLEQAAAAQAEQVALQKAARSRLAQRAADLAARRRDLEVQEAGISERQALTARRLDEVEERLRRNVASREEAAVRRDRLQQAMEVTEHLSGLVEGRRAELDVLLARLREARRIEAAAARARSERLDGLRRQRSTAERQLGETRERVGRIELESTEARVRLEALTASIRHDLDSEPEGVRGAPCPPLPPGTSASSRRSELERELRLMGPINPLALEEHAALLERNTFLEEQLDDVRRARRELAKVIRAVDGEIIDVLRAAFADVAENFETLFTTLFPGGQGRLRLTDPDHLLETGIEVEARPSGKNVRRLSLLSGGERSLTAMAFLFAVFRSRPSPFYLMDEVEAALDDVNLHRFLDLVHEFRSAAQLVIVSHQKRTMEAADCLYGVTMPPGGSSRVVSEGLPVAARN